MNRDNARLVTELSDLQRVHRDLKDTHAKVETSREALTAAKHQLESALSQKDAAHAELVAAHAALQQQYDEARNAVADLETRSLKFQTELEVQRGLFETLRQQIRPSGDQPSAR